jgi:Carboxypeptidase regulatory-like domain
MRFLVIFLALADCGLAAQLRAKVIDPTQSPVSGASIEISDLRERVLSEGKTNVTGQFTIFLSPGRYVLRVSHAGFQDQSLTVTMGQNNQAITIAMALKEQKYSVTVSDATRPLDTATESHQDSLKLGPEDLENLPVKDGDVLSALAFFTNPAGGQSPTLIVDMERTDGVTLTAAQILQVRINNNAYSAEFPKPGKGRIEIDTRGGSDVLHGDFSSVPEIPCSTRATLSHRIIRHFRDAGMNSM